LFPPCKPWGKLPPRIVTGPHLQERPVWERRVLTGGRIVAIVAGNKRGITEDGWLIVPKKIATKVMGVLIPFAQEPRLFGMGLRLLELEFAGALVLGVD